MRCCLIRFPLALKEGRRAALVPEGGGVIGQVVGTITSALFIQSKDEPVEDGPVSEVNAIMRVFDDAEAAMIDGDVKTAVKAMKRLQGYPATAVG